MGELEEKLSKKFSREYEKYYPVKQLRSFGYKRYKCKSCGNYFWSIESRDFCGEAKCINGYSLGKKLSKKKFTYFGIWETFSKFFKKYGYVPIPRYPIVSRWYPELYFVVAGINIFQPRIINGEVEPFEYLTTERQFCVRFSDVDIVGYNPKSFSGFIMLGQHAFNTKERKTYFKEEGIEQIHDFLTKALGIDAKEIIYNESFWYGGGNLGPSIEFLANGIELGNQVYIQYKLLNSGIKEIENKTIDMGAGMERIAWALSRKLTSYDITFPYVLRKILKNLGMTIEKEMLRSFLKYSHLFEEGVNFNAIFEKISREERISYSRLREEIERIAKIYVLADHTRTLLVAIRDGALPSNVGGGYNLRNLLRRCLSILKELNADFGIEDLMNWQIYEFGKFFPELRKKGKLFEIINVEREKYENTKKRCIEILEKDLKKGVVVDSQYLLKLYDSYGINPELVKEVFEKKGIEVRIPSDFYKKVQELHEKRRREEKGGVVLDVSNFEETKLLFYDDPELNEFDARVLGILKGRYVVLDRTAFYPTGGGQIHDTGYINESKVLNVFKINGVVVHEVDEPKFKVNNLVKCRVDLERRKAIIKNHTATHIINRACMKVLGDHIWQHGSYKDENLAHLDITHFRSLSREELEKIEKISNEIVRRKLNVKVYFLHRNEAEKKFGFRIYQGGVAPGKYIRIVEIEGFDAQACGGLHCRNTKEIELIKIINVERVQDGVMRLTFKTGKKAIEEVQARDRILDELRELWKVKIQDIPKTAKRFFDEWKKLRKENDELKERLLKEMILSSIKGSDICYLNVDFIESMGMIIKVVNELANDLIGKVVVFHCKEFGYAISRKANVSAREELLNFYEKVEGDNLNAKGFKRRK